MIICHCHVVSDREIRRAATEAGPTCRAVAERCGAGGTCKGCVPAIEALLRRLDAPREPRQVRPPSPRT